MSQHPCKLFFPMAALLLLVACGGGSQPGIEATVVAQADQDMPSLDTSAVLKRSTSKVSRIIDGDTFEVVLEDGSSDTVRLLGVDTPETNGQNKPYEYGNITNTACLDKWGAQATSFAFNLLQSQLVILQGDSVADERGFYNRLLAYVKVGGQDFGSLLLAQGYARVYEEGESSKKQEYLLLQSQANVHRLGLWGCG
jgi:micrococcal nuclease